MNDYQMGAVESRFADIIWENEPLSSGELVKLCEKELSWKKSTTYTVLHKLTEKGVLQNEGSVVTSLVGKEEVWKNESAAVVERAFEGSLPGFVAAFLNGKGITPGEAQEIRAMLAAYEKGEGG